VQGLKISYSAPQTTCTVYENYALKVTKGDTVGVENPDRANHAMSAVGYALNMFAGQEGMYDPQRKAREEIAVSVTRPTPNQEYISLECAE
jgi:hypothetical protein